MPSIVADRFVANGASWTDLATGQPVRLRIVPAAARVDQLAWSERCSVLAKLRHPRINALVDYGALDASRLFEAYAVPAPPGVPQHGTRRSAPQAVRFLQSHGVSLSEEIARVVLRDIARGVSRRNRVLGLCLQPRPVLSSIDEALEAAAPAGPALIHVVGPPASGLRTLRVLTARAARLRGYVPLAAGATALVPGLVDVVVDRHVCLLTDDEPPRSEREAIAALLGHLARNGTRRHVVITFGRSAPRRGHVLRLEPMGVTAMTAMVYIDGQQPSPAELFDAARGAAGRPGLFLARLNAEGFEPHASRSLVAHETVQIYDVGISEPPVPPAQPPPVPRPQGVLARAAARGEILARRGRHGAAIRLLSRAARVLAGRGDLDGAGGCLECLGRLHLERGHVQSAAEQFERARALAPQQPAARLATLGLALARIEDARLVDAEALLRSLTVTAAMQQTSGVQAACALAESLYWQGRYCEALAALQTCPDEHPEGSALAARVLLAAGEVANALQCARRAVESLTAGTSGAVVSGAHAALALALAAAGDAVAAEEHVTTALGVALRAHLPMDALRTRVAHVHVRALRDPEAAETRRLAQRLLAVGSREALPRLLRLQIAHAVEDVLGPAAGGGATLQKQFGVQMPCSTPRVNGRLVTLTELESLLAICHSAGSDRDALERLCAATAERLRASAAAIVTAGDRRTIAQAGRGWPADATITRVLASGTSVQPGDAAPLEAAEPVKYAGELLGAIACRWAPGTDVLGERSAALLKAAAIAAAASVRAHLDRSAPDGRDPAWPDLLGASDAAVSLRAATARAARAPFPVLIEGESGSGKELIARAIHRLSGRRDRRFCAVNCAALTDELLESELFGHTRGAFTGAVGERIGLFEEADGGTLFLDEIGELSPRGQAKLLRVLQEGEIRRVGENFARRVDVRLVAATNRRLHDEAAAGRFRHDLRFRLDVVRIAVPALRERRADIPVLARHFWEDAMRRVGSHATLAPDALAALSRYDWPGNVRELQNVMAWMAVHSPRRGRVGAAAVPATIAGAALPAGLTYEDARADFERRFLRSALARANGNRGQAAESIGLTRQGLVKMMRRLNIDDRPFA